MRDEVPIIRYHSHELTHLLGRLKRGFPPQYGISFSLLHVNSAMRDDVSEEFNL